jgi:hypothetical protein
LIALVEHLHAAGTGRSAPFQGVAMMNRKVDANANQSSHTDECNDDSGSLSVTGACDAGMGGFRCRLAKNANEENGKRTLPSCHQKGSLPCNKIRHLDDIAQ